MATVEQIRAQATAALGAASTANLVQPAPTAANTPPSAVTSNVTEPQPKAPELTAEEKIAQLQAQLAQALGIIATISPKAVAAVEGERTYHSASPFVKIQVMKAPGICEAFQFRGGKLTTDDPAAIAFLEASIAAGNTGFSHAPVPEVLSPEEIEMRADVRNAAVVARDKMVKAGETVA